MSERGYEPPHRQRYRLRRDLSRNDLLICPEWLQHGASYEGDVDPSSQDYPDLRIRLLHPTDPNLSYLLEEDCLEEVD